MIQSHIVFRVTKCYFEFENHDGMKSNNPLNFLPEVALKYSLGNFGGTKVRCLIHLVFHVYHCYGGTTLNIFNQKSFTRNNVDPVDLRNSPDYTLVYGVDLGEDKKAGVIIEYDDNRRKGRDWHKPLKNNEEPRTNMCAY